MSRRISIVSWCFAMTLWADAVFAGTIVCAMEPGNATRYVAPLVSISYDGFGPARITDAVIETAGHGYITGEVAALSGKRISVRWRARDVVPDPRELRYRHADLLVRLTIEPGTGGAEMAITDASDSAYSYRASGVCELTG